MDKVMKCLGNEMAALHDEEVKLVMHCNVQRSPMGGGRNNWLLTLRSYALKFNPTIDDIHKQSLKEFEAIEEALETGFEYLFHPLGYKHVKDQMVVVLKGR
ncbi:unnamed protein product [Sphagnum balticum]